VVIVRGFLHAPTKQHGVVRVESISDRKLPKMSTYPTAAFTRSAASLLIERAERQTGSRMAAYDVVASALGTSASWLRKFIKGREIKEPGWTTGWRILDQYSRLCDRVEAEIEVERTKILALKGQIDATAEVVTKIAASAPTASATRKKDRGIQ
jgi:hypothetical protein